jgi:hypothetical protein
VSRVDDGARSIDGLTDRGVQSHGVTRASHLRPGQWIKCSFGWGLIETVDTVDGEVMAKSNGLFWVFPEAELVPVRDILHPYTESETP